MQLASFCNLYCGTDELLHGSGKRFARVAAIDKHVLDAGEIFLVFFSHCDCTCAVSDIRGGDVYGMRDALRVDRKMPLDAGYFLSRIISFEMRGLGVLHALGVNDAKRGLGIPAISGTFQLG